jgi:SAM-dependent methyltransferase
MTERPFAEYASRNAPPILEVLRHEFASFRDVLEIGSGTGQHAVTFASALPHLRWQTSDLDENHAGIRSWLAEVGVDNILPPLSLDVRDARVNAESFDAVFSSNTAHIMSQDAVGAMFSIVGRALRGGGRFCLYGPFRQGGAFNTPSNAAFDADLRGRDPSMGIRDLEALDELGDDAGLRRVRLYAVPSNNHIAVWEKEGVRP